MKRNTDLTDLLKEIINRAVEVVGGSYGTVKEIDAGKGICLVEPLDGGAIITAQLHAGQKPKLDSKIAYITSHLDTVEEDNYTVIHIFDYDEQLVKGNKKVLISVEDNKITVIRDKIHIATEEDTSPAVLGDKLAELLADFKNDILKHSHPYPGTPPLAGTVAKLNSANIDEIKSEKVFLE